MLTRKFTTPWLLFAERSLTRNLSSKPSTFSPVADRLQRFGLFALGTAISVYAQSQYESTEAARKRAAAEAKSAGPTITD